MHATNLHHLGVPCISQIREIDETLTDTDAVYYLNPKCYIRYQPDGAVITPAMLYSSFIYADKELSILLQKKAINIKGLPKYIVDILLENEVLLKNNPQISDYREFIVKVNNLPNQVLLDVTSKCQCRCISCYHKDDLGEYTPSLEIITERIVKLKELGISLFEVTGGEPFLREDLEEVLLCIYKHQMLFYVVTNGEFLHDMTDSMVSILQKSLGLAVSLDGIGAVHDNIRQRLGLYDKLLLGLQKAVKHSIPIYLISTMHKGNVKYFQEMVEVAKRFNTTVHLRPAIITGGAVENKVESVRLQEELKDYLKHPNVRNGLLSTKKTIPQARFYGCGIMKRISVSANGVLFPCVMDRRRALINIDLCEPNIIAEILKKETNRFKNKHKDCKDCDIIKDKDIECGGFCRFSNIYNKGASI